MKTLFRITLILCLAFSLQSCFGSKKTTSSQPTTLDIRLDLVKDGEANKYINLDYGIRLNIKDVRAKTELLNIYDASVTSVPTLSPFSSRM